MPTVDRALPPNTSNDVVFDSSALMQVLDAPTLQARLIDRLAGAETRMIVPLLAASEVFAHDNESIVAGRASTLRSLRGAGIDLRFAHLGRDLRALEDGRVLHRTPVISRVNERQTLGLVPGWYSHLQVAANLAAFRQQVAADKIRMFAIDEGARERLHELREHQDLTADRTVAALRDRQDWLPHLDWLIEAALGRNRRRGRHWARIKRRIERYKAAVAWAGCAFLTMWGVALPPNAGHAEAQRLRLKHGNWYDNEIASSAAYARVLVVNDRDVLFKVAKLRERGLVTFAAQTLNEFLGDLPSAGSR